MFSSVGVNSTALQILSLFWERGQMWDHGSEKFLEFSLASSMAPIVFHICQVRCLCRSIVSIQSFKKNYLRSKMDSLIVTFKIYWCFLCIYMPLWSIFYTLNPVKMCYSLKSVYHKCISKSSELLLSFLSWVLPFKPFFLSLPRNKVGHIIGKYRHLVTY